MVSDNKSNTYNDKVKNVLVLVDISQKISRDMLVGIIKYANICKRWLIHRPPLLYRKSMNIQKMVQTLTDWKPDGIIINYGYFPHDIHKLKIPVIAGPNVISAPKNTYSIVDNSEAVSRIAAKYFINLGFKKFAYCGFDHVWSYERGKSFVANIKKAGFEVSVFSPMQKGKHHSWKQQMKELSSMVEWLKSLEPPVALFACNDDRAEEVIEACKVADLKIPGDISILGADNDELFCKTTVPELSSIDFNMIKNGYSAAKMLDKLMAGEGLEQKSICTIPTHVVTRQSTNIMVVKDEVVAEALKFIKKNCGKLIQVEDVARFVGTSERELRRRFRNCLARSVQYEIIHARVEFISEILVETDLTVSQIASKLGYPESKYITRFFKKMTGMTPSQYRFCNQVKSEQFLLT